MATSIRRIALVTGGAGGLGGEIAERLAREGMAIALADINGEAVADIAKAFSGKGHDCQSFSVDVADETSVAALFQKIEARYSRLDVAINCAGILGLDHGRRPLVETMSLALWQRTLDVNLTGTFLIARAAIPLMKRGKWGRIVNIASRAARMRTGLGNSNYAASKAALLGFSRVLAGEVGRDGITVNCIAPSRIVTAMTLAAVGSQEAFERNIAETAVGRLAEPRDVAGVVSFLCSPDADFLTGLIMDVNGGSFMA
jgi:NAD(P)-dependent dehydrogenase (short-subunit alcohol dehydrogenase family)